MFYRNATVKYDISYLITVALLNSMQGHTAPGLCIISRDVIVYFKLIWIVLKVDKRFRPCAYFTL